MITATTQVTTSHATSQDCMLGSGEPDNSTAVSTAAECAAARATVHTAQTWGADLAQEAMLTQCTTIGMLSGSRHATPRYVIEGYVRLIADALSALRPRRSMLIVRLDGSPLPNARRVSHHAESAPHVTASPLGPWSEVTVAIGTGKQSLASLEKLSYQLPTWKREFGFVLVDLGSIAELPGRLIGRHCDSCFVLLGPQSCGSHEWLLQHVAWHARSGSTICGTLVTELE